MVGRGNMSASCPDGHGTHENRWLHMEDEGPSGHPSTCASTLHRPSEAPPMLICRGIISVGRLPPRGWGTDGEPWPLGLSGYKTIAVGIHLCLFGRGKDQQMWKDLARSWSPQRMLYRPSASDLATANSTCWRPLIWCSENWHSTENWHSP